MSEFDKIICHEDIKADFTRFTSVLKEPEHYSKLGVTMPTGILLYGNTILEKTLMAKFFIAETECKVYTSQKKSLTEILSIKSRIHLMPQRRNPIVSL